MSSFLKFTIFATFCFYALVTPTLQCNCTCSHSSTADDVSAPVASAPTNVAAPVAAAPAVNKSDCSSIAYSVMPCLSYLTDSTIDTPSQSCCDGVKEVVDYNPYCLCVALEGSRNMGFDVNATRALASPVTCKLSKTEMTCDATSAPVTPSPAPVASPVKPTPPVESPVESPVKPTPPVESPVKPSPPVESPVESPVQPSPAPVKPSPAPVKPSPTPVSAPSQPPPAPSPSTDCSTVAYGMVSCLSFLTPGSLDVKPAKDCCDSIETVVDYDPRCLCVGIEGSRDLGFTLNNTRAYNMPTFCNIAIDPHCQMPAATPQSPATNPPTSSQSPVLTNPPTSSQKPPVSSSAKAPVAAPLRARRAGASQPTASAPAPSMSGAMDLSVSKSFLVAMLFTFVFTLV